MEKEKLNKIVEAARLYYQLDYSQQDIAKKLDVSRPTVSRLLKQAKEKGIVEININDPIEDGEQLSEQVKRHFDLKEVIIANVPIYDGITMKKHLGEVAASYLHEIIKDHDIIATSWGTTIFEVAKSLKPKHVNDTKIVQLNGGVSHSDTKTYATEIIHLIGEALNTQTFLLPLPAIVDHIVVKNAIEADRHIRKVLDMGKQANIAIFSVGIPVIDSVLLQAEYLSEKDQQLIQSKAAGEICSRFFDANGNICIEGLNNRTIGIELKELAQKEKSILVAGGAQKLDAIHGALIGKYANVLVTDQYTAKMLIEI